MTTFKVVKGEEGIKVFKKNFPLTLIIRSLNTKGPLVHKKKEVHPSPSLDKILAKVFL